MIHNEEEYRTTLVRIAHFQKQVDHLRKTETNPENYRLSAGGFLAELDRMNLEVREGTCGPIPLSLLKVTDLSRQPNQSMHLIPLPALHV
jgi:hypothetical protein